MKVKHGKLSGKIILIWVFAILFLLSSFTLLFDGNFGSFFVGLFISLLLGYWGYKKYKNPYSNKSIKTNIEKGQNYEDDYETKKIKVAGVTFENRQKILENLKNKNVNPDIKLKESTWEGKLYYEVYADNDKIGAIPKNLTDYIHDNYHLISDIPTLIIYGGGYTDTGKKKSFGAKIIIEFLKDNV